MFWYIETAVDITALQKLVQSYQQQSFNEPNLQIEISGTNPIFIYFLDKEKAHRKTLWPWARSQSKNIVNKKQYVISSTVDY